MRSLFAAELLLFVCEAISCRPLEDSLEWNAAGAWEEGGGEEAVCCRQISVVYLDGER